MTGTREGHRRELPCAAQDEAQWPTALIDALPVAVGVIDGRGCLTWANKAMGRLLGAGDAAPGFDLHDIGWPGVDDRPGSPSVLDAVLAGGAVDGVVAVAVPQGRIVDLRVHRLPRGLRGRLDGGLEEAVAFLVEATPGAPDPTAAAMPTDAYRQVAEHLGDLVLVSRNDMISWVSPSIRHLMGYQSAAVLGRSWSDFVHPDDRADLPVPASSAATPLRGRWRCADGSYRWFDTVVTARAVPGGGVPSLYWCARDVDAQVRAEQRARAGERRLRGALDSSPDGFAIYHVERDGSGSVGGLRLLFINAAGLAGFADSTRGGGAGEASGTVGAAGLLGRELLDVCPEAGSSGLWDDLVATAESGSPHRKRIEPAGGSPTGVTEAIHVRLDTETVLSTWRDVTDLSRGERLLATAYREAAEVRATLQMALDATSDGFAVFDLERDAAGRVTALRAVHTNVAATQPLGLSTEQVQGRDPRDWLPQFQQEGVWNQVLASIAEGRPHHLRVHLSDHRGDWTASWDNTVAPVGTDRVVLTWRDVTIDENTRRHQEHVRRRAEHDATHDALTGLPNRVLLRRRLLDALSSCPRGETVGVVYCDLDDFKQVNDRYGHAVGDAVLKAAARRLRRVLRSHDTAARLAGDEFVLVLRYLPMGWDAEEFLERTAARLTQPVGIDGIRLESSASLGIVLADPNDGPDGDRDVDALLAAADEAMYRSKAGGHGPAVPRPLQLPAVPSPPGTESGDVPGR